MSIDLYSSNAKLVPPKVEAVGWDWESESKSELQSEGKLEAKWESEPECKRGRWELTEIDDDVESESDVSSISGVDLEPDPEWEEWYRSGLGPEEVEPEKDSRTPPWELKDFDDLEFSDFSMYDDDPLPIAFQTKDGLYMNQTMIREHNAYAEYLKEGSKLPPESPWDYIPPPQNLPLVGGVRPYTITQEERPRFIHYCNLSLNKYNAENQGANFVFYELVKATSPVSCPLYYITFMAKDASNNNNNTDVSTFQAEVSDKLVPNPLEAKVILCKRKPN